MDKSQTICAVVVTYNRKKLLEECLKALLEQSHPLDAIYVIDNASTDGTGGVISAVLESNKGSRTDIFYIRMNENIGGAGGFYEGIKTAYEKRYDWVWLLDDDIKADPDCLNELLETSDMIKIKEKGVPAALACARFFLDGSQANDEAKEINLTNPFRSFHQRKVDRIDLSKEYFEMLGSTFEGLLVKGEAVDAFGFPDQRFFIFGDDTDYCLRLQKFGKIYCVPKAKIIRLKPAGISNAKDSQFKKYYSIRNLVYLDLRYSTTIVKFVRVPIKFLSCMIARFFYMDFYNIPLVLRSFRDAYRMLENKKVLYNKIYASGRAVHIAKETGKNSICTLDDKRQG